MKGLDLSSPIRQLVERKLWPLAVLLLAGLAAVPLLLAKGGAPAPVPAASVTTAAPAAGDTAGVQPVVQLADASGNERRRSVLGTRKDPFRPARSPRPKKVDAARATVTGPVTTGGSTGSGSGSSGGSTVPSLPPLPVGSMPTAPKKTYELYSLTVRFGETSLEELPKSNLKRLKAMPNAEDPVVIYLGLLKDRRTAVFLVDAKATIQGDGRCLPSPGDCQTVHLKVGETAFFDVADDTGQVVQYQLDLVRVARKRTSDAEAARRSFATTARGGREALRPRVSRVSGHRYNRRTGTVERAGSVK